MKYNTSEEQLRLRAYGRGVQQMVDALMAEPDKDVRTRMAHATIKVMGRIAVDQLAELQNPEQRLWEHLQRLSGYQLDVDAPYPLPTQEPEAASKNLEKKVGYYTHRARFRQFGKNVEIMAQRAAGMPEGPEREAYALSVANYMKHSMQQHAKNQPTDKAVINYMNELAGEDLGLDPEQARLIHGLLPNKLGVSNASRPAFVRKSAKKTSKPVNKKKRKRPR